MTKTEGPGPPLLDRAFGDVRLVLGLGRRACAHGGLGIERFQPSLADDVRAAWFRSRGDGVGPAQFGRSDLRAVSVRGIVCFAREWRRFSSRWPAAVFFPYSPFVS